MHIYLLKADRNISLFYVQTFLRHPAFQGISASLHVDERYAMMPWMVKNDDVSDILSFKVLLPLSHYSMHYPNNLHLCRQCLGVVTTNRHLNSLAMNIAVCVDDKSDN